MSMKHRGHRARRCQAVALACVLGLTATACGSGDSPATDTGSNASSKASGEPIRVGFLSLDLGAGSIPDAVAAQEAATKRINDEMGGINGRPLEVVVCSVDASPEKNIGCANQLVDEKVAAVIDGFDYASGATLPILHAAKIPLIGPAAFAPEAEADRDSFYFGASQAALGIAPLLSFEQQGLKNVTFAAADSPASRGYHEGFMAPAAESLGLNFQTVYYPLASPNFQNIAASIAATKPDVGGVPGDESQCTALVQALRATGYTNSIFAGTCTNFIKAVGAEKAGDAQMYTTVWLPEMRQYAPAEVQDQLDMAMEDLEAGDPASEPGYYSYATYAAMMTLADVLRGIDGRVDEVSVARALASLRDAPSFLGPKITCDGSAWPGSSACTNEVMVATLQPDGSLKPNDDGGFLQVDPSVLSPAGSDASAKAEGSEHE